MELTRYNHDELLDTNIILDFINRRFKDDCNWISGNCYYFSLILKDRFPKGDIYYDVINGHFLFKYQDTYFDWEGVNTDCYKVIKWNEFDKYDSLQKRSIIRDCIL